jgi:hypothetical protein
VPARAALLALLLAVLLPAPAPGQTRIHGIVVDGAGEEPIPAATVTLSTNRGRWRRSVRTDPAGLWSFDAVSPGAYTLRAARLGYAEAAGELEVAADTPRVTLRMGARTVALRPFTVVGAGDRETEPMLRGFYARLRGGAGRFVTRAEIEERSPSRVSDLLRGMPNVSVLPPPAGLGGGIVTRGSAPGGCAVVVFVDGVRLTHAVPGARLPEAVPLDDHVSPGDVEGIELYRGESDTPAEFSTRWSRCGTVVVWTRRGTGRGAPRVREVPDTTG